MKNVENTTDELQHAKLYILSQQEVLQELDQENRQLRLERDAAIFKLRRIRTALSDNGVQPEVDVVDGVVLLIDSQRRELEALRAKAITSISQLQEAGRQNFGRYESQLAALREENQRLTAMQQLSSSQYCKQMHQRAQPSKQQKESNFEHNLDMQNLNNTDIVQMQLQIRQAQLKHQEIKKMSFENIRKHESYLDDVIQQQSERLKRAKLLEDAAEGAASEEQVARCLLDKNK